MTTLPTDYTSVFEDIAAHEDITIPCQHRWHDRRGCVGDAQWVVWMLQLCCSPAGAKLWCNDCLVMILNNDRTVWCAECGTDPLPTPKRFITHYERLVP